MTKSTKRHHYVPAFLTRHFSKSDKMIFVYDKIGDKIYEGHYENLFVEKHRNTFPNLDGIKDDIIERVYASFDYHYGGVLTEITNTNSISSINFKHLLSLAYISKWRVPRYDESFQHAKEYFSVDDLGLGIKDADGNQIQLDLEDLFDLEMQQELKRFFLAMQPFRFKEDFKILIKNSFIVETPLDSFIGDCPFNEATIKSDRYFEDFVFPITKDLTLVFSTRIDIKELQDFILNGKEDKVKKFLVDFSFGRDVSMLHLAERNVACADRDHLENVVTNYNKVIKNGSSGSFNLTVFNVLYRYKDYMK